MITTFQRINVNNVVKKLNPIYFVSKGGYVITATQSLKEKDRKKKLERKSKKCRIKNFDDILNCKESCQDYPFYCGENYIK